ncbi:hypothetical protein [Enterococcus casseliflavus]|uniref:hypothetical protein n=1 Tax=Enterococcus casseliflavus TaxID=37734 RepID=UPI0022E148DF|nr:hypothetical protein [Enterococcus casseliflavus]
MPVVQDEISLTKVANGGDGRGILGTPVATYAQSTSGTIPPTTWSATRPNVPAGQYLWTRVVTTYTDNTTSETQTPTLMGKPGDPGLGIKSKSISYAVGTSGNTPPTSGWQETIPTVSANQYLWTKTTLVYTDESKTEAYSVGKMGADGANAKLLYLTASAENMAFNADDTPKTTQTINISAKLQNVTGTATFVAVPYIGNTAQTAITLGGSGNTRTLTSAQWTNKDWTLIAITATLDNLSDTLSIVKVKDGKEGETYYPHPAWMMADGTFTKVYPNENLIVGSISPSSLVGTNSANQGMYPYRFSFGALKNIPAKLGDAVVIAYDWEVLGDDVAGTFLPQFGNTPYSIANRESFTVTNTNKKGTSSFITSVAASWLASTAVAVNLGFRADNLKGTLKITNFRFLISDVDSGWLPSPSEDYENAYPKYEGFYSDTNEVGSDNPDDYKPWTPFMGPQGPEGDKGDSAPLISLSGATQAITVDKDGKITPSSSFTVTGTALNTSISNWTYSLNGGNFGSAVPTGVTRSGNTVTINPVTATFDQLTIRAADATVSDVYTVSRIKDGSAGLNGADAYIAFLTNESYTFAGSTDAALAGSTTTEVVVYKGINKITPTSVAVGTKPTGLSSSVSGSVVTFTAATTLVTKSGTIPLTITADGKTFTKQFAYAISFQGGKGEPGQNGVSVTGTQVQYVQSSGTTEPTTGWSNTRPTPVPGQWLWTRSRSILSDGTYGSWVTVPTLIGREAIVINATAPSNPSTGTLWQMPSDPNVKQWEGTKWVDWGISIDNLIAENAVFKDGKFETLEGVQIIGSQFISPFDKEKIAGGTNWIRGTLTNADGMSVLEWAEYNKSSGATISTGTNRFYPDGISTMKKTGSIIRSSYYGADGIQISDGNLPQLPASLLTIEDIVQIPKTLIPASSGYSQYATSGDNAPFASRSGRIVQLSGAFKNNTELASGVSGTMGILPDWARPERAVLMRVQASYNNTYLLTVNTDGTITMSRHAAGASNVAVPSGSWLNIAIVYAAKNL